MKCERQQALSDAWRLAAETQKPYYVHSDVHGKFVVAASAPRPDAWSLGEVLAVNPNGTYGSIPLEVANAVR